jgi:hypothetical protein
MKTTKNDMDFSSLSLKDLIEARDLYHFHLMSKPKVVGTAIGLYLMRDPQAAAEPRTRGERVNHQRKVPRTFDNSHVTEASWPCILVLVREWIEEREFGPDGKARPWQAVPKRLYLPDGRVVPICTVLARPVPQDAGPSVEPVAWPQGSVSGCANRSG